MSNKEILEKAISLAIDGGWQPMRKGGNLTKDETTVAYIMQSDPRLYVYSHDFAKALWGEGLDCAYCGLPPHRVHPKPCPEGNNIWPYLWEYHLQQMVIAEDPIKYLGENINE